jgi:TonB family protein
VRVLYRVPDAGVLCEWTVLLRGGDEKNIVLAFNEDAARYLIGKPGSGPSTLKKLSGKNAAYPTKARDSRIQGTVKMMVHLDTTGHVDKITVISGPEALRDAAVTAVNGWVYEPLVIGSSAVPVQTLITMNFAIGSGYRN